MGKGSFIFYNSILESIEVLEVDEKTLAEAMLAVVKYGVRGEIYKGDNRVAKSAMRQAMPLIDANKAKTNRGGYGAGKGNQNARKETLGLDKTNHRLEKNKPMPYQKKILDGDGDGDKDGDGEGNGDNSNQRRINSALSKDTTEVMSSDAESAQDGEVLVDKQLRHKLDRSKQAIEIQNYYNQQIKAKDARLRYCQSLSEKRIGYVSGRLAKFSIDDIKSVIDKAVGSHFLNYEATNAPVDFEWIMRENNFIKILEGKYEQRPKSRASGRRMGSNEGNIRVNDLW